MNKNAVNIGWVFLLVGGLIFGGSVFTRNYVRPDIDYYETLSGSLGRAFDPEAQNDYELKVLIYDAGFVGIVIGGLMALSGFVCLLVDYSITTEKKEGKKSIDVENVKIRLEVKKKNGKSPLPEEHYCEYCEEPLRYVPPKDEWYCDHCRRYINLNVEEIW